MTAEPVVFVVDDDDAVRDSLKMLLGAAGYRVRVFESAVRFLAECGTPGNGCLIVDIRMPDMDGLELQQELVQRGVRLPTVVITGHGDVPLAVKAMKNGAVDFIEKPFSREILLSAVEKAFEAGPAETGSSAEAQEVRDRLATLTEREREVYEAVVTGKQSKTIAFELGCSPRTVEVHRARMMHKMQARSLQSLVRMAIAEKGGVSKI